MKAKSANKKEHPLQEAQTGEQSAGNLPVPASPSPTLKSILVPIDFSPCSLTALDYACALAQKFRAKLILLHVVEPASYPDNYLINASTLDEANGNLLTQAREQLNNVRHRAGVHGLVAETLVRMGRAQSDITDTANATGVDLIVMGAHGTAELKQVSLGGTAERVLRHCACPVLTVPQSKK